MLNKQPMILVVDDDVSALTVISSQLKYFGYQVITSFGVLSALDVIRQNQIDLVISDLYMPDVDGLKFLDELHKLELHIPFIVMTACGNIETAVQAIRKGAFEYIEKPFNADRLHLTVQRALEYHRLKKEHQQIKTYLQDRVSAGKLITNNPAMHEVISMAEKVAEAPYTTVAIFGESGTGKEVLSRYIHMATTGMPTGFVAVNCAAIPEHLMESELFGHVKGAFTGASSDRAGKLAFAQNGTLLLDEIGEMPLPLQAKLLRALQERSYEKVGDNKVQPVTCRIIVATNVDLKQRVAEGKFREDLFHRINVFPLTIPPLRARTEDICQICDSIMHTLQQHLGKALPGISQSAMELIRAHSWPGNIRELRNSLERAAILTSGDLIRPEHLGINQLPTPLHSSATNSACVSYQITADTLDFSLSEAVRQLLVQVLAQCDGNKTKAAQILKINRKMFYRL